jgi:DHA1 family bicyclomycin/chloramphenicol resistance-like MFS transporter
MSRRYLHHESPWLLALLAAMVALGPLSVDMYIPAMPNMMVALDTTISSMHLTMSAYLTGFAVFHLVCGPLADRYGRKPILLLGTAVFVIGCLGCAVSTTMDQLLLFRLLQGIGACVGPTLARTVTRDVFGPTRAARALSLIAMLMALAPADAPMLGGLMLLVLTWNSIFVFLAVYGAVMIVLIQRLLAESLPQRQSLHPLVIARNYRELVMDPFYLSVTVASGLVYAGLIAYLSSSSFVYIEMLGVPVEYFGLVFLTAVAGYMTGSGISARLAGRFDSEQVMLLGSALALFACVLILSAAYIWPRSVLALMLPMMFYSTGLGLVLPHAMAIALRPFPHIAGTASALLGFVQMSLSAVASALTGVFLKDSPMPMLWAMLVICLLAMALALRSHRLYHRSNP